jgi:hypothetical protein
VNESQSQDECIGFVSGSLYTQENRRGIEECIGENNEKKRVKEDFQLRMQNHSQESKGLSLGDTYNTNQLSSIHCRQSGAVSDIDRFISRQNVIKI